jgi:hypothetical protein
MIDLPKIYTPTITSTPTSSGSGIKSQAIANQNQKPAFVERRLSPTRRKPKKGDSKIERRVSSDRRRSSFSYKA